MSATVTARPEPRRAVLSWWRAMEAGDVDARARATLEDHLAAGGPGGRVSMATDSPPA